MLGFCLGMQLTCVEFARHVLELADANSAELNPDTPYPIIDLMRDQIDVEDLGGTLRLGLYPSKLKHGSRRRQLTIIKKLCSAVTVIVMSLTMIFASSLRRLDLYFQEFHQTIAWSK